MGDLGGDVRSVRGIYRQQNSQDPAGVVRVGENAEKHILRFGALHPPKGKPLFLQVQGGRQRAQPCDRAGIAHEDDVLPFKAAAVDPGFRQDGVIAEAEGAGQCFRHLLPAAGCGFADDQKGG